LSIRQAGLSLNYVLHLKLFYHRYWFSMSSSIFQIIIFVQGLLMIDFFVVSVIHFFPFTFIE
jgi:hypothetical protein